MRFNPDKYDPTTDSSPVSAALAKRIDGDPKALLVLDQSPGPDGVKTCESGSRAIVTNPKSRFCTGKDAALKGKLIRAHLTGTKVVVVPFEEADTKAKLTPVTAAALTKAQYPKFSAWLDKAKKRQDEAPVRTPRPPAKTAEEKAAAKAAKAAEKAAAKAAANTSPGDDPKLVGAEVEFKIGRNTKTGQVVRVEGDSVTVSYQAAGGKDAERVVKRSSIKVVD